MRLQVRYHGRVQGVGFRATARDAMTRHLVVGWVRNEPDGTVLLEVQGTDSAVDNALADIRAAMKLYIRSEHAAPIADDPDARGFVITGE